MDDNTKSCFIHISECLGMIGDWMTDNAMDARVRIEMGQEIQDRVACIIGAVVGMGTVYPEDDDVESRIKSFLGEMQWHDDGGALIPGKDD